MNLVPDWKQWSKWWSVRLSIAGGVLLTFLEFYPNAIGTVIQALPSEVRSNIDPDILKAIGILCVLGSPIARVIKQHKLENPSDQPDQKA